MQQVTLRFVELSENRVRRAFPVERFGMVWTLPAATSISNNLTKLEGILGFIRIKKPVQAFQNSC